MAIRARGEGTISRRSNGTYEGKLSLKAPDGSMVRKSFYGKTRGAVADMMPPRCHGEECQVRIVVKDPWGGDYRFEVVDGGLRISSAGSAASRVALP